MFSTVGEPGSWNDDPTIFVFGHGFWDDTDYKLYISGFDGQYHSIGLVTTSDLETGWEFNSSNPVLTVGDPGSWDEDHVFAPMVIEDGGIYKMWYTGIGSGGLEIGYATSSDGLSWTKDTANNPVLEPGSGAWEEDEVLTPYVIKDGDTYKMWYAGNKDGTQERIGYATSTDGINWTKYENNPVLDLGPEGAVLAPSIMVEDGQYLMWYLADQGVYFAMSDDGIIWTKDLTHNPVLSLGTNEQWDITIAPLQGFKVGSTYKMLYFGTDATRFGVGLATLETIETSVENYGSNFPMVFALYQNYPNPFNPSTRISYSTLNSDFITLKVYDILGREIQTLVDKFQKTGEYSINFDATNLSSGIYFYRLQVGSDFVEIKKMLMMR